MAKCQMSEINKLSGKTVRYARRNLNTWDWSGKPIKEAYHLAPIGPQDCKADTIAFRAKLEKIIEQLEKSVRADPRSLDL